MKRTRESIIRYNLVKTTEMNLDTKVKGAFSIIVIQLLKTLSTYIAIIYILFINIFVFYLIALPFIIASAIFSSANY